MDRDTGGTGPRDDMTGGTGPRNDNVPRAARVAHDPHSAGSGGFDAPSGDSGRGALLRWGLALLPAMALAAVLLLDRDGAGLLLIEILFAIAAGALLLLAFDLVAKLRHRGAGRAVTHLRAGMVRVALAFGLFWLGFAHALELFDDRPLMPTPRAYLLYALVMLALLLLAFVGAYFLGRLARPAATAAPPGRHR
jgi:hypothetical protein